jgi:hypothetical protein
VFGASNVSKLLLHVPVHDRCEAVVTIAYEAQARIRDPVYGCVAHIFALQQQVLVLVLSLIQTLFSQTCFLVGQPEHIILRQSIFSTIDQIDKPICAFQQPVRKCFLIRQSYMLLLFFETHFA